MAFPGQLSLFVRAVKVTLTRLTSFAHSSKMALTSKVGDAWTYNFVPLNQDVLLVREQPTSSSSASRVRLWKPTRWGRCSYRFCTGRVFRPVLSGRGPFLVCGRRGCLGKRDLTVAVTGPGVIEWFQCSVLSLFGETLNPKPP